MDLLRDWVQAMHVDGASFDLTVTLSLQLHEVDKLPAFFDNNLRKSNHFTSEADRYAIGSR